MAEKEKRCKFVKVGTDDGKVLGIGCPYSGGNNLAECQCCLMNLIIRKLEDNDSRLLNRMGMFEDMLAFANDKLERLCGLIDGKKRKNK